MFAIRIRKRLESDTVPELKPLIGKDVEIVAEVNGDPDAAGEELSPAEIARQQGILVPITPENLMGGWPSNELNDGFEQKLERRRQDDIVPPVKFE